MANIAGFRASVYNGGVRPNAFSIEIDYPAFVTNAQSASLLGTYHCRSGSLPSSTVAPIPLFYQGRSINVAGEREFQPWQCMIYNEDFKIRDALETWSNGINNITNNTGVIQPTLYQTNIRIRQLDRNGIVLKTVELFDAMPIEVGAIELDWENNAQIETFPCTFVYNYYTTTGVNA